MENRIYQSNYINKSKLSYLILYIIINIGVVYTDIWFMSYLAVLNFVLFLIYCIRVIKQI